MARIRTKLNSLSIKWKIFLYLSGFCGIMLVLLWLMQVVFLSRIYENVRIHQMISTTDRIEAMVTEGAQREQIDKIAKDNDACVLIIADNGTLVHSSDVIKECKIHKMSYMNILKIVANTQKMGGELRGIYSETRPFEPDKLITNGRPDHSSDSPQSMIYCRQLISDSETLGYVIINIQLTPVNSTVSTLRMQLYLITAVMLFFSLVLATVISANISKPMEKLSEDARKLATGDYETVFDATGYAEINRLSQTLTRTAEELGKVEKLRKDFIANVSHDLRTPLTLIGGYAEVMRDIPGENNSENAQLIIDETHRLSTLVNDVLDMSRIQSGAVPMQKKEYNITDSVRKTVERMKELLKQDGYEIDFVYDKDVMVAADEARISQCFYNILINAVNYTGEDKKIIVEQEVYENIVRISVTDTGDGIDEKDLPYVWERYYKNDKNHKRSITGTGLGLSIVRSVIKAHNGSYGAYNTKDKGACFWFTLPLK